VKFLPGRLYRASRMSVWVGMRQCMDVGYRRIQAVDGQAWSRVHAYDRTDRQSQISRLWQFQRNPFHRWTDSKPCWRTSSARRLLRTSALLSADHKTSALCCLLCNSSTQQTTKTRCFLKNGTLLLSFITQSNDDFTQNFSQLKLKEC